MRYQNKSEKDAMIVVGADDLHGKIPRWLAVKAGETVTLELSPMLAEAAARKGVVVAAQTAEDKPVFEEKPEKPAELVEPPRPRRGVRK